MDQRPERRASNAGRPEENVPPREDPHATSIGRGADPGDVRSPAALSGGASIAGQRGHGVAGERGGPEAFVDRENEDSVPEVRGSPRTSPDAAANDAEDAA